jgi:acyl-CoA synthetase (AMP-forming)/AMP-acid ligase II
MKWAVPRSIEFRASLPTTLVGKIAYTQLEKEERDRLDGEAP